MKLSTKNWWTVALVGLLFALMICSCSNKAKAIAERRSKRNTLELVHPDQVRGCIAMYHQLESVKYWRYDLYNPKDSTFFSVKMYECYNYNKLDTIR